MTLFDLKPGRWCAWQMLPGYMAEERKISPYYSPIHVRKVEPLKSGKGLLRLSFFNACYASGLQDFELTLQVLARRYHYLFAAIAGDAERCVIVGEISAEWLVQSCPNLIALHPQLGEVQSDSELAARLTRVFS